MTHGEMVYSIVRDHFQKPELKCRRLKYTKQFNNVILRLCKKKKSLYVSLQIKTQSISQ